MKLLLSVLALCFVIGVHAQNEVKKPSSFIRVYDLQGRKIAKGRIVSISDSALKLIHNKKTVTIPPAIIGTLKTKRSGGNTVLMGSAIVAATFAIWGAIESAPSGGYSPGLGATGGLIVGGIAGAVVGGIATIGKEVHIYRIHGDTAKWGSIIELISN